MILGERDSPTSLPSGFVLWRSLVVMLMHGVRVSQLGVRNYSHRDKSIRVAYAVTPDERKGSLVMLFARIVCTLGAIAIVVLANPSRIQGQPNIPPPPGVGGRATGATNDGYNVKLGGKGTSPSWSASNTTFNPNGSVFSTSSVSSSTNASGTTVSVPEYAPSITSQTVNATYTIPATVSVGVPFTTGNGLTITPTGPYTATGTWRASNGVQWEIDIQLNSTETSAIETIKNSTGYNYSRTLNLTSTSGAINLPTTLAYNPATSQVLDVFASSTELAVVSCQSMKDAVGLEGAIAGIALLCGCISVGTIFGGAAGIDYLWGKYYMGCDM